MALWRRIDAATPAEARELLRTACGSTRWVDRMLARRPYNSAERALATARDEWLVLGPDDWCEAFAQHPRIGDIEALRRRFGAAGRFSENEQAGVAGASEEILAGLAAGNREYEAKFGYIFIVCATGRSAAEMLEALRARLQNDPDTEIRIAAGEQAKITALRLLSV